MANPSKIKKEWLVTDGRGAFAMGTAEGFRTRKYHGFYLGIAGRSEASFLADLDIRLNGRALWPHRYRGDEGPVTDPDPSALSATYHSPLGPEFRPGFRPNFRNGPMGPEWQWNLPEEGGGLRFAVCSPRPGVLELQWSWEAREKKTADLEVRPFFSMRPLHALGGESWILETELSGLTRVRGNLTQTLMGDSLYLRTDGKWSWAPDPQWYFNFVYSEELERGYPGEENLFSAGSWKLKLLDQDERRIRLSTDPDTLATVRRAPGRLQRRIAARDFVLQSPAGVVAGYPWFGEWGRDTFISLPGLAMSWLEGGGKSAEVREWVEETLARWGQWIQLTGMLPNLIEKDGSHQWQSADATLWWCHSLASLWAFSLAGRKEFAGLERRFRPTLDHVIQTISANRHLFLRVARDGALEVTEPHTTWMDARVAGLAVTPRVGRLPEINALWFQARCLQALWSEQEIDLSALEALGRNILEHSEIDRPNFIFLHSLPLAPSFVLRDQKSLRSDLARAREFWTPMGLRSLLPTSSQYQAFCVGTQHERDLAYHQGTVWAWLGGHFEMVKERAEIQRAEMESFSGEVLEGMPIEGHISEIFDGQEPHLPRGAPAQAWSLACRDEAMARKCLAVNLRLSELLARRWLGREERRSRASKAAL